MAAIRTAGTAFFKLDGTQYSLGDTLTIQPLDTEREGQAGLSGITGFSEKSVIPYIEVEVIKTPDLKLKAIGAMVNTTVTGECADGTTYVLRNAWFAGTAELDGGEGKVTLRFEGLSCNEI